MPTVTGNCCCPPGDCQVTICPLFCGDVIGSFNWWLYKGEVQVAAGSQGTDFPHNCLTLNVEHGEDYLLAIRFYGVAEGYAVDTDFGFTASCGETYNVTIDAAEGYLCDCQPCPGQFIRVPDCVRITGPGGIDVVLQVGSLIDCALAIPERDVIKFCGDDPFCLTWDRSPVPMTLEWSGPCTNVVTVSFPVSPRPRNDVYDDPCEQPAWETPEGCDTFVFPPCDNQGTVGGQCPDFFAPVGGLDCDWRAVDPDPDPFPCGPPDPEEDPGLRPSPVCLISLAIVFPIDCESEEPYDVDAEINLGGATLCLCDDGVGEPGTATSIAHPIADIIGEHPVFSMRRCR